MSEKSETDVEIEDVFPLALKAASEGYPTMVKMKTVRKMR